MQRGVVPPHCDHLHFAGDVHNRHLGLQGNNPYTLISQAVLAMFTCPAVGFDDTLICSRPQLGAGMVLWGVVVEAR